MKQNKLHLLRATVASLTALLLMQVPGIPALHAADDGRMAHNIYSDPDVSKTSGGYDTFTIDFRATETPDATYWALANFGMDLKGSMKQYPNATGGGAYAGLQHAGGERKAIMSFWEISYRNGKILRASRVFPGGKENDFGGEGEGTNWITPFKWEDNKWYRMVLHCWKDAETGTTFAGEWFQNIESGEWSLVSYFDTHLTDSFFKGNMSQFMENFSSGNADPERDFNYKNMYVLDHEDGKWKSLAKSELSYDTAWDNKRGSHEFGATEEYFWGKASGLLPDGMTQDQYDKASTLKKSYTIKQPDTPTFGDPKIDSLILTKNSKEWKVSWKMEKTGTPQLSYKLELLNADGEVIASESATRPETNRTTFDLSAGEAASCRITVTDIFGKTCSEEKELTSPLGTTTGKDTAGNDAASEKTEEPSAKKGLSTGAIAGIAAGAAAVVAAAVAVPVVMKKKKKNSK